MCRPSTHPPPLASPGGPMPNSAGCGHSPPSELGQSQRGHQGRRAERAPFLPGALEALPAHPAAAAGQRMFRKLPLVVTSEISTAPPRLAAARRPPLPRSGERGSAGPGLPCARRFPSCTPRSPPGSSSGSANASRTAWREGSFPASSASSAMRQGRAPPWPGRALPAPWRAPRDQAASAELPPSPRAQAETWKGAETSDFQQPLAGFPCIDSIPRLPGHLAGSPRSSRTGEDTAEEPCTLQTPKDSAGIVGKLRYWVSK